MSTCSTGSLAAEIKGLQDGAPSGDGHIGEPDPLPSSPSTITQTPIGTPSLFQDTAGFAKVTSSPFKPGHVRRAHHPLVKLPPEFLKDPSAPSTRQTEGALDSFLEAYGGIASLPTSPGIRLPSYNLWGPDSPTFDRWLDSNSLRLRLNKECVGSCEDDCRCSTVDAAPQRPLGQQKEAIGKGDDAANRSRTSSLTLSNFGPPRFFSDLEKQMDTRIVQGCLTRHGSMKGPHIKRASKHRQNSFSVVLDEHSQRRRAERARSCHLTTAQLYASVQARNTRTATSMNKETAQIYIDESSEDSSFGDSLALEQIGESLLDSEGEEDYSFDDEDRASGSASPEKEIPLAGCFRLDADDEDRLPSTPESHQAVLEIAASDSISGLGKVKMLDLRLSDPEEDDVHVAVA